ncbi:hypothetical protein FGO68_gene6429 [Halteria grandinella]|uniref:C2H2-type domain-containing protein n=1 Tax=Halteria grandinella TaxID=5974 RepID=A0A8J8NZ83_HALGN|nr:hypothetical protein FGO68_gene6429 [Halteria grandinella]
MSPKTSFLCRSFSIMAAFFEIFLLVEQDSISRSIVELMNQDGIINKFYCPCGSSVTEEYNLLLHMRQRHREAERIFIGLKKGIALDYSLIVTEGADQGYQESVRRFKEVPEYSKGQKDRIKKLVEIRKKLPGNKDHLKSKTQNQSEVWKEASLMLPNTSTSGISISSGPSTEVREKDLASNQESILIQKPQSNPFSMPLPKSQLSYLSQNSEIKIELLPPLSKQEQRNSIITPLLPLKRPTLETFTSKMTVNPWMPQYHQEQFQRQKQEYAQMLNSFGRTPSQPSASSIYQTNPYSLSPFPQMTQRVHQHSQQQLTAESLRLNLKNAFPTLAPNLQQRPGQQNQTVSNISLPNLPLNNPALAKTPGRTPGRTSQQTKTPTNGKKGHKKSAKDINTISLEQSLATLSNNDTTQQSAMSDFDCDNVQFKSKND